MKPLRTSLFLFLWLLPACLYAQEYLPEKNLVWEELRHTWNAFWISAPEASLTEYGVFHFRKTFELDSVPEKFIVHVSADNRYRLYVNGKEVSEGPARSDLMHWRYETVDIAPFLQVGTNALAALVFNMGEDRSPAQFSRRTEFILQADDEANYLINTDNSWKVLKDEAFHPLRVSGESVHGFYVTGPCDSVVADRYPWGWEQAQYDDKDWKHAKGTILDRGVGRGYMHGADRWLVPRNIPPMEKREEQFPRIVRTRGLSADDGFLRGQGEMTIKPGSSASILLDREQLTIGYPELTVSGGNDSKIRIEYAEALYDGQGYKGNRNETDGKEISGAYDIFLPDGGDHRIFSPLWLRCFRYVQINIETANEPLTIHDFHSVFTAYPFEENASVYMEPDTFGIGEIWETGWRTARLCAGETYFDCPYYEQLQYVGDTRIQALISLYVSGDDRLMRNAIQQFSNTIMSEGLTQCRAPSDVGGVIPTFSLYWVGMVHDYHMHRDDPDFVKQFLPEIRSILSWFECRMDETGMLGPLDWWCFVDWANGFPNGIPEGADNGNSALMSLTYVYALEYAGSLFDEFGLDHESERYRALAASIKRAVQDQCYDPTRRIYADTPGKNLFSQHTNIMAILTGTVPGEDRAALMEQILSDSSLIQASLYYRFYLMRALARSGLGDRYMEMLGPWNDMIDLGLSTFPETEPGAKSRVSSRSDCHAWSSSPCYDLLATVCGIMPAEPGFRSVRIQPHPGPLQKVQCEMPHPAGPISVNLERRGKTGLKGTVVLPEGTVGEFKWNEQSVLLGSGEQEISFK